MANVTIIRGPAGSGKTHEIVERLAQRYGAQPINETLVLVPTTRHGGQLRRRLMARCGVAAGLRVETLAQFSHTLAEDQPARALMPSGPTFEELLARTARDQVANGPAAYFAPIAETGGFLSLISSEIDDLLAERVDPRALTVAAATSGAAGPVALSAIYGAYVAEIERRNWVPRAQAPLTAAVAVSQGAPLPELMLLDGFNVLRGTELALLTALVERSDVADVVIAMDPDAGSRTRHDFDQVLGLFPGADVIELPLRQPDTAARVEAGSAADREEQVRAIARQIKQRLVDNPALRPSDCAVTFRQVMPWLSLVRHVFAEYDVPLDPAAGERLSERPLGVWLSRLLSLADDGWRVSDTAGVLANGIVNPARWGFSDDTLRADARAFAKVGRESGLWAGQDALGRILDTVAAGGDGETPNPEAAARVRAAIADVAGHIAHADATLAEHARRLDAALFGDNPIIRADVTAPDGVSTADPHTADVCAADVDALRGYLREFISTGNQLGESDPEPFESFAARLRRKMSMPVVMLRNPGGVLLAPMHTMHGLRFDFVAAGGLVEGEFPARRTGTKVLDDRARAALAVAGLGLPPEARLAEDELWNAVSTRADGVTAVWRSRVDERGRPVAASWYYDGLTPDRTISIGTLTPDQAASPRELAIACVRQWAGGGGLRPANDAAWPVVRAAVGIEQLRRSYGNAGAHEGRLAPGLVPRLTDDRATWSSTRLESYRTCAFQFFGQYGMRLYELDEEMDNADAAARGTVIHDILDQAIGPLVTTGRALSPETLAEVQERVATAGREIWDAAPQTMGFGRAALWRLGWETERQRIFVLLEREATLSRAQGAQRVLGTEQPLSGALPLDPPMRLTAKLDRIDAGDGFVSIVDYKTGAETSHAAVMSGDRLQLPLYAYLAAQGSPGARVTARYAYTRVDTAQPWELDSAVPADAAVIEAVVESASEVRNGTESGDFRVNPQEPTCPTYCAFRHVCRVNEYTRWKKWT